MEDFKIRQLRFRLMKVKLSAQTQRIQSYSFSSVGQIETDREMYPKECLWRYNKKPRANSNGHNGIRPIMKMIWQYCHSVKYLWLASFCWHKYKSLKDKAPELIKSHKISHTLFMLRIRSYTFSIIWMRRDTVHIPGLLRFTNQPERYVTYIQRGRQTPKGMGNIEGEAGREV